MVAAVPVAHRLRLALRRLPGQAIVDAPPLPPLRRDGQVDDRIGIAAGAQLGVAQQPGLAHRITEDTAQLGHPTPDEDAVRIPGRGTA